MIISIKNKTGFSSSGGAVMVTLPSGKLFYQVKRKSPFTFNLPKGTYKIQGNVKMLSKPIEYRIKAKRVQESRHPLPKRGELKIEYGDNPNKASIFIKQHRILIDNSYKNAPEVVKAYLIAHEIGHYRYKTERYADEFAQQVLLDKGYPMTLIVQAAASTLYNGHERHTYCYENMKNAVKR